MTKKNSLILDALEDHLETDSNLPAANDENKDIDIDYEYSREKYKDLVDIGMNAINELSEVAKEMQHPRAYEVLAKAIKDVADTADKLLQLQKDMKKLEEGKNKPKGKGDTTNNNIYIGNATDLQRMLQHNDKNEQKFIGSNKEDGSTINGN